MATLENNSTSSRGDGGGEWSGIKNDNEPELGTSVKGFVTGAGVAIAGAGSSVAATATDTANTVVDSIKKAFTLDSEVSALIILLFLDKCFSHKLVCCSGETRAPFLSFSLHNSCSHRRLWSANF